VDAPSGDPVTIENLTISNGYAPSLNPNNTGGGILNEGAGVLTLSRDVITGNEGGQGGGVSNDGGSPSTLIMNNCSVLGNMSATNGGGLYNGNGDSMTISQTTIGSQAQPNETQFGGGGISNQNGSLSITQSTIAYNEAVDLGPNAASQAADKVGFGGGIATNNATGFSTTLTNCTIAFNVAGTVSGNDKLTTFGGGGIATQSGTGGALNLINCTVASNSATDTGNVQDENGGGGILNAGADTGGGTTTITLLNTIVANNTASSPQGGPDINGNAKATFSLIFNTSGWNQVSGTGNNQTGNPDLGPLANNGGPNTDGQGLPLFTMALETGSAAISKGTPNNAPMTDERGEPRKDPPDIGAYETPAASSPGRRRGPF
jgi:hypothetical protein